MDRHRRRRNRRFGIGDDARAAAYRLASASEGRPDTPPQIPKDRPPTSRAQTRVYMEAAKWFGRIVLKEGFGRRAATFLSILEETGWLQPAIDSIRTFGDPPKSLEELQQAVSSPAPGYDTHHIVEKTPAEQDGFPRSMIDSPENMVRIPRLKHWLITGWYMTPNEEFGWLSPRAHLRQRTWDERVRVGHDALIDFGVVKE